MFEAVRAYFRGEEIQKSKSGGGKDLEEFEVYLPVSSMCRLSGNLTRTLYFGLVIVIAQVYIPHSVPVFLPNPSEYYAK